MADRIAQAVAWCSTRTGSVISTMLVAAVAAWFALPALFIPYSEGFQPQVVLNAYALAQGDLRLGDTVYPFSGQFFLLTRLGTTLAVLGLQRLGDLSGLLAFRLLGIGSLLVLVGALLALLWRVYRVGPVRALLCCILFPPIFESAYLPNDNMPSAALACLALLLFWTRPTLPRTAAAGLLLGLAALVRLDAALIAPAFAILLLTEVEGWGARAVRACVAGALVVAVPVIAYELLGLSFFDTFAAVNRATLMWDRPHRPLHNNALTLLHAVTALGGVAWLLGVASFARRRQWRDLSVAVAVPLFYVAAYRSQLVEGRYLLPLSPFVLLAMAEGLGSVAFLSRRERAAALAADDEGPRLVLGRVWNPLPTLWWQTRLRDGEAAVAKGIERAAAWPDPVIVTGYWTGDRLTAALLMEHGFAASPDGVPEACRGIAENWNRGPAAVLLVRTHIPFLHQSEGMTWQEAGLPCVQAARPGAGQVLVVNSGVLDRPAAAPDAPGAVFSAAGDRPPPLVPGMASLLAGVSVAVLPLNSVSAALDVPQRPEDRQAAAAAITNRSSLLR